MGPLASQSSLTGESRISERARLQRLGWMASEQTTAKVVFRPPHASVTCSHRAPRKVRRVLESLTSKAHSRGVCSVCMCTQAQLSQLRGERLLACVQKPRDDVPEGLSQSCQSVDVSSLTLGVAFSGVTNPATQQHLTKPGPGAPCNIMWCGRGWSIPTVSLPPALTCSFCDSAGKPGLIHTRTHQGKPSEHHSRLL